MAGGDLSEQLQRLEDEMEEDLRRARTRWQYRFVAGRVRFARKAREAHRRLRQSLPRFLRDSRLRHLLAVPVIFSLIVPIALLDLWITCYQQLCFPIFGIARVKRSPYLVIDRHHLAYLNVIEKLNCVYCGYANGVFAYVREIAGRTEQFWCPIRHATRVKGPHPYYRNFVDYGDAAGYRGRWLPLREQLKRGPSRSPSSRAGQG